MLSAEIGDDVSHGAVWGWVRKSGRALRREEDQQWKALFEDGEVFEGEGREKKIVVTDRRFKKHGMSWTTEGANNPLKIKNALV